MPGRWPVARPKHHGMEGDPGRRIAAGFVSPKRILDLRLTVLWLDYTLVTGAIAVALVLFLPALVDLSEIRP